MFKDYVLGAEVAKKGNFHIANISMLLKDFNLVEGIDYQKYGGITLLNKKSLKMPNYIYTILWNKDMTNLEDYLPMPYFKELLDNKISMIRNKYKVVEISDKQFIEIKDEKLKDVIFNEKLIKTVVDFSEIKELLEDDYILGYEKISSNKALVWY
jgi:flagellar hook-basal body complex protein FliE